MAKLCFYVAHKAVSGLKRRIHADVMNGEPRRAVLVHAFNPSTWEAEAGGFLTSRPAWSIK